MHEVKMEACKVESDTLKEAQEQTDAEIRVSRKRRPPSRLYYSGDEAPRQPKRRTPAEPESPSLPDLALPGPSLDLVGIPMEHLNGDTMAPQSALHAAPVSVADPALWASLCPPPIVGGDVSAVLANIQARMTGLQEMMQAVLLRQEETLRYVRMMHSGDQGQNGEDATADVLDRFQLPIDTMEDLRLLENELETPEVFEALTSKLARIGGRDPGDVTRKILSRLLTNQMARKFNWRGVGGKECFSSLHLINVVINASLRNFQMGEVQERTVVEATQKWLRNAFDRDGGRNERALKKLLETGHSSNSLQHPQPSCPH